MKLLKMSLVSLIVFCSLGFAASLMEEKLNLEKSIQGNVERLVEKIIGTKEMVVLVNVDLGEEPGKAEGQKLMYPGMSMTEEEYLPGVTYTNVPFSGGNAKGVAVKKITVLVTLDQKIDDAIVVRIKKEVQELIGLDSLRGDAVNVQKIAFAKTGGFSLQEYIQGNWIKQAYWLIIVLILTIFLFGPLRVFFRNVLKNMEMKITADTRIRNADVAGAGAGAGGGVTGQLQLGGLVNMPAESEKADSSEKEKVHHFSFVNKENLKSLIYLAKKETPENISIIINYLSPECSSQVLASLMAQVQNQVITNLADVKLLDPEQVKKVEGEIGEKISYLSGGEEYFLNLIEHSDHETHVNIINALEQANPSTAERVRRELFFFEDVNILEKTALQRLVRESQRRGYSFALALKNTGEEMKNKVMGVMTPDAKAMLQEQMDLLGEVADKRITEEQRLIANLARELEKTGIIIIDRAKKQPEAS